MNGDWQTRETLLMRAKNQDDDMAWEEFVSYYREFIYMVLNQMSLHLVDVDDLVQDILVKIWKSLPNHIYDRDRARFRTWLSRLIRNLVLDHVKAAQRRRKRYASAAADETVGYIAVVGEPEVEKIIQSEWEVYIVQLAIKNVSSLFSERAIEAFSLSIDGMSTEQIAKRLGVKPNSVIKLKNRVKERLIVEIKHLRRELEPL